MIYTKYTCPRCRKDFSYSKQPSHKVTIPDWEDNEFKYELCGNCFNQLYKWLHFGYDIKEESSFATKIETDFNNNIGNTYIPDTFYISQMQADIEKLKEEIKQLQNICCEKENTNNDKESL